MSMYGNCQHKMTSDGCLSNSYCPPKNEQEDTACRQCDVNMMPGIYCNCQDNLRLNCSQCNGIFCQACITGFVLQKDKCELQKGNCSLSQNTCPHNTFCQRQNTKSCQSCYNISILDKCNCAGTMIQGCLNCDQNKCLTCISSLILYNGNCVDSIPRIDCRNIGARCPTGTYCRQPEKICSSCAYLDQTGSPNNLLCECYGKLITGCAECSVKGCQRCHSGLRYTYGACQVPGDCKRSETSFSCSMKFYCDPDNDCMPCETMKQHGGCHCNSTRKMFECMICGPNLDCAVCKFGFLLVSLSIGKDCAANYCTEDETQCSNGYYCPEVRGTTECLKCSGTQPAPCKCFYMQNCLTCNLDSKMCDLCLPGFVKNRENQCVAKTNVCSPQQNSDNCDSGFVCLGKAGDDCKNCQYLTIDKQCNCDGNLIENCLKCNGKLCRQCPIGFLLVSGECIPNRCGETISTQNCLSDYYCPKESTQIASPCLKCDAQQQECKCGNLQHCQTCGSAVDTCSKCFYGYEKSPSTQHCQLKTNICDYANGSTICFSGNYCKDSFGDPCVSCTNLTEGQKCNCGGKVFLQCLECSTNSCAKCLYGYFLFNGNCVENICFSGGSSNNCLVGTYCPPGSGEKVNCIECSASSPDICSCGANNCQTCGSIQNTCGSCIIGYQLDKDNQCTLKPNICDTNNRSSLCNDNYYCKSTFGNSCSSCGQIQQGERCRCDGSEIANCIVCSQQKCQQCLSGFKLYENTCVTNMCDDAAGPSKCFIGFQCPPGSLPGTQCQECSVNINSQCQCDGAQNCHTCGEIDGTCKDCLYGYKMNENTLQCEKITDSTKNICDDKNMSSRCDSQQFCIGSYGDSCLSCSMIQLSKSCNCDTKLKENCLFCDGQQCMMCLKGYYVHNGECLINKCDSKNPCFDNFYCDPATNSCTQCSSIGTYDCNCGSAQNCQTCAAQGDTCQTCIRGYNLINGSCYPKLPCLHTADCPLNQYCGSDNKCDICFGQPTSCNCGSAINCYYCGASGGCASCLPGYGTDQIFSCSIPICSIEIPPGSYCSGPDAASKCPSATTACNCGFAQNCSQCTADLSHCEDCLDDSIMIDNECVIAPPGYTGVCNDPSDSSKCLSGFACILVPTCHSCQNVSAGYLCNCHGKQYASCIQCDRDKCGVCFTHFVLIDGKCETECQASSECKIGQQCGRQRACQDCNGQMECNCDGMLNCKECNDTSCTVCQYGWKQTDKSSCAKCASGFVMSDGICNRVEKPENKVLTAINIIGMVFALIIIICGILGIIIYYVRRPKRHTFQHSMAR